MTLELIVAIAALAIGLWPLLAGAGEAPGRVRVVALLVGVVAAAGLVMASRSRAPQVRLPDRPAQVLVDGYTSSTACRSCHPGEYASWKKSYHRTMTQSASPETIEGDFSGQTLSIHGTTWTLESRGEARWIVWTGPPEEEIARSKMIVGALVDNLSAGPPQQVVELMARDLQEERRRLVGLEKKQVRHERPIVQVTGSHHYQVYWYPSTLDRRQDRVETINKGVYALKWTPDALQGELMPFRFVFLLDERRWVPRDAVFVTPSDPRDFGPWNNNCLKCHTTHGRPKPDLAQARMASEVAEFGIACESCHGPAEQHVKVNGAPHRRYGLHLSERPDESVVQPERLAHKVSSQVCGQCHSVSKHKDAPGFLRRGSTFRPGGVLEEAKDVVWPRGGDKPTRESVEGEAWNPQAELDQSFWPDGIVRILGREYNGMLDSACHTKGEMACTSCHSMHESDPDDQLARGKEGDEACLQCHGDYRGRIEAHTHHPAGSSGSECMGCHMPYNTFGLLKAARSHTIESPSVKVSVEVGRPNACNQCHLDKTLAWSAEHLSAWYGAPEVSLDADQREISATLLWLLKGDAAQRVLAIWTLGSGPGWQVPFIAQALDDPYDALRLVAHRALKAQPGFEDFEFEVMAPSEARQEAIDAALLRWASQRPEAPTRTGVEVLLDAQGAPMKTRIKALSAQRDDRPVILAE